MKKQIGKLLALAVCSSLLLIGCSGGADKKETTQNQQDTKADNTAKQVLVVGATPEPHASILEFIKPQLEKDNIDLEIKVFTDYKIPNTALEDKELDANFFQHKPYLDEFNENTGTKLISACKVHLEPMGLYSKKIKNISELQDKATISIPNDPTNGGRALLLLQKQGLIELKDGASITATDKDIVKNPKNLKFVLLDAAQLPRTLDDVDASVINTNFALEAKLDPNKDAIVQEDKDSPYANIIAIREDEKDNPKIEALVKALNSDETKNYINEHYKGAIIPAF